MFGIKFPAIINCVILVILLVINGAGSSTPWLAWVQTSRRWTRLRAIMDPTTWVDSTDKPYHLLLSSESAVDKSWFAIGYDQSSQYLYWSDTIDHRIYRQKQNDSLITRNQETIEIVYEGNPVSQVTGIAVDWFSGAVYWTDSVTKTISITRGNPGHHDLSKVMVSGNLDEPSGITVHPARGEMYFSDKGNAFRHKIEKANLLGENRQVILSQEGGDQIGKPECLSYDYSTDTLYWVDGYDFAVKAYNFRDPVRTVVTGLTRGIRWPGITNYQDYIFLSDQGGLQIQAYHKNDGRQVKTYTVDATPHHLVIAGQVSDPPTDCDEMGCEHFCVSLGGGRGQCVCADGYYIELDRKSCLSVDPQYIYSKGDSIWHADVTIPKNAPQTIHMTVTPFITDVVQVQALAFHYKKNYLYLNDIDTDILYRNVPLQSIKEEITVNTRQVEGTSIPLCQYYNAYGNTITSVGEKDEAYRLSIGIQSMMHPKCEDGMTVNWLTDTLYWADNRLGHIMCSELDGRYHKILIPNARSVKGLAADAMHKMLFWIVDNGQEKSVMVSKLDGSEPRTLFTQGLNRPQGIAVDSRTKKVYWTDTANNKVYSMDLDGASKRDVIHDPLANVHNSIYGVTIFNNYTSYTAMNEGLKFGLRNKQQPDYFPDTILSDIHSTLRPNYGQPDVRVQATYDVITYDSYMQPNTDDVNVCKDSSCQQLCFPVDSRPKCECAIGFKLNEDGTSCDSNRLLSEFVIFTDPYHKQIYQMGLYTDTPEGILLPDMDFPVSMDIDSKGTVYWIDRKAGVIQSGPMLEKSQLGESAKLLRQIPQGFSPETLVVDEAGGHVYYTDSQVGAIYRMNLDGSDHDSIINGVGRCTGLVIDTANELLFWSELGARLMMANLDGSNQAVISHDKILIGEKPRALTYRPEDGLLYWADELTGTINSYDTSSRQMSRLFRDQRYWIISLAADLDYLYFTTQNEKGVFRIKRGGDDTVTQLGPQIFARITDIKTFQDVIVPPVPVVGVDDGFPWMYALIGGIAALFLLFLICMIGLCAVRRKKTPPPASSIVAAEAPTYENVDNEQEYVNVAGETMTANGTANGTAVPNGIPPPPEDPAPEPPVARVHYTNNGFTADESDPGSTNLGPAVAVLPAGPVAKPRKTRYKKKDNPPKIDPNDFQLGEDQKVATVIQRLAHRLRNRLSSVRFSGDSTPNPSGGDQENQVPEYDPENADGVPGGPDRSKGPGPKRNITYPPQLHRPPRGYAPASHSVPLGALKSSWGRGKHAKVMGKKK